MNHFCTLFDINYLSRGIVMYESLKEKIGGEFNLYVLTFDLESFDIINGLNLDFITPIKLEDFENHHLLAVKSERTPQEYCWTCTPWIIKYVLEKFKLSHCTYLDADLCFYKDPKILLDELNENDSILITEHDYYKKYDQTEKSGKYCVQFMYFKNDIKGLKALNWWANQCIKWCYNRHENGKFGDQKYIESFPELFEGVHVLRNKKMVLAPWNVQKYMDNGSNNDSPIFFHFHGVRYIGKNSFFLGYYKLNNKMISRIYLPYLKKIFHSTLTPLKIEVKLTWLQLLKIRIKNILGNNHLIKING